MNIIELLVIIFLIAIFIMILYQNKALKKEKRIGKYSIYPHKEQSPSIIDKFLAKYYRTVKTLRKYFNKSPYFKKQSKKYEKYLIYQDNDNLRSIDYLINKCFISIIFVLLVIFSFAIQEKNISLWLLIVYFIIGYYLLDIYLIINYKRKIKKMEEEMLKAVMIMNNAFKSGKSTLQAVKIASEQLPEPINREFQRIYHDLEFGLSVDVVFERFASRVNLEEARYLSSSLTILNKTGGNIVQVFSSIERTLFDRKKMKEELNKLTASSKMVTKFLLGVPFVFVLIIYFLNPSYFDPFFNSTLGIILLGIIIIMFILYIYFLEKIMKVGE